MPVPNVSARGSAATRRSADTRLLLTVAASALLAGGGLGNAPAMAAGYEDADPVHVEFTPIGTLPTRAIAPHDRTYTPGSGTDITTVPGDGAGIDIRTQNQLNVWPLPSVHYLGAGDIDIDVGNVTATAGGPGQLGINALNGSGDITIAAGNVDSNGTGIQANIDGIGLHASVLFVGSIDLALPGMGAIDITAGNITSANGMGVDAHTGINSDLPAFTSLNLAAMTNAVTDALTGDAITIDVGDVNSHDTGISAVVDGGTLLSFDLPGLGAVSVAAGDVTSTAGSGIVASTGIGGVHVAAGDVSAGGGTGVSATSGFAVNIPDLAGLLGGSGGTPDLSGLMGLLDAGVSVDVGNVDASGAGIVAEVTGINVPLIGNLPGIGNVSVNAGDVDAGGNGITAGTGIGYAMVNAGNVDAGGDGIAASAGIGLASVTAGNVSAVGQGVSATVTSGNLGALEDLIDLVGGVPGLEDIIGDLDGIGIAFAMVGDVEAGAGGVNASAGNGAAIAIAGDVTSVGTGVRAAVGDDSGNGIGLALAVAGDVATSDDDAVGVDASARGIAAALGGNVTTEGNGATGVRVVAQGGALGGLLDGVDDLLGGLNLGNLGDMADDLAGGLGLPPGLASGALDLVPDLLTLVDGTAVAAVGSVETSGDNAMGIYAEGTTAVVLAGSVTTTGGGSTGIRNMADGTSITIFGSVNTSGNNAPAVHATDPSSDVWVIGGIATTSGDDSEGIHAWSGTDDVNIYVAGVDTEGHRSGGIHAAANAGDIDIYAGAVTTAGEDSTGIRAWSGDGDIDVATLFVSTEGDGSEGIRAAANAGDIGIDAGAVTTAGADATGIRAWSGDGDIDIDAGAVGTVGDYADGIRAVARNGDVSVDAFVVGTLGAGSAGISAAGGGAVTVTADWVGTAGDDSVGIHAWSSGGPVSVTAEGVGTLGAGSAGIHAVAGAGDVGVTAGNVFTLGADADAIHAWSGDGDVTVDAGSAVALGEDSRGVYAMSDNGSTEVTVHDAAIGGWGAGAAGVEFGGATGAVLNNEGTIAALSGLAIRNDGRDSVVNNDGTVYGRVSMGGGADVFNNNADGVFAARGTSSFGWGAGDEFNNAGLVRMQWRAWPETVRILGLDTFNNFQDDGLGGQVGGTISLANGITGDRLMLVHSDVNAGDADNGNVFAIDAWLTPDNSPADQLHVGGDLSGTFNLAVNDLDSGPGAYDPNGHLFAVVAGDTDVSNFSVNDGDGIDKGLFRYDAYLRPGTDTLSGDNEWYLASTLDREAFEFPIIAGAVQDTWHASTGVWLDRTSDLRLGFGSTQEHATAGAWARFFTGSSDLDFSNTATAPGGMIGPSHTYADTLHQSYHGIVAGFDRVISGQTSDGSDQSWIFGAMLGQTSASLDFGNSVTRVETEATTVGAYVTYLRGGLYVDALLKGDYGTLDYANSGLGASASGDFRSLGFTVDGGYRLDVGSNWFVEPVATLAWVRTTYDGLALPGADVEFDDGESMRGRIGVRVGNTVTTSSGAVVEPWLEASLWNEFQGNYGATIGSSGPDARASYDMGDSWGELSGGVSFLNSGSGWTGFAKATVIIGDGDRQATSGNLGVRYTW